MSLCFLKLLVLTYHFFYVHARMSISPWIFLSLVCFILAKEVEQHIGIYSSPYESPHGTDIVIRA